MRPRGLREMSPALRGVVISVGVIDIGLRFWALRDLARRPSEDVAGPKAVWALGLVSVSSAGVLPLAYLVLGRRSSASGGEVGER